MELSDGCMAVFATELETAECLVEFCNGESVPLTQVPCEASPMDVLLL